MLQCLFFFQVNRILLQSPDVVERKLSRLLRTALYIPVLREIVLLNVIPTLGNGACRKNPAVIRASYRLLLTNLKNKGKWTQFDIEGGALGMLQEVSDSQNTQFLCLWGEKDTVVPSSLAKYIRDSLPNTKFVFLQEATHDSFAGTDSQDFADSVVRFLSSPSETLEVDSIDPIGISNENVPVRYGSL